MTPTPPILDVLKRRFQINAYSPFLQFDHLTFERGKGGGDILSTPDFEGGGFEPAGPRRRLKLMHVRDVGVSTDRIAFGPRQPGPDAGYRIGEEQSAGYTRLFNAWT